MGLPFRIGGLDYFKGKGFLEIDVNSDDKNSTSKHDHCAGDRNILRERLFYDEELTYFASDYDQRVELLKPYTRLEGLFQSENYLYGKEAELGDWIRLSGELREKSTQYLDLCVVNIRGGEYKRHNDLILTKRYWQSAMQNIREKKGVDRFLLVTDDQPYAKFLFPDLPVLEGGVGDCYAALYGANCLIVSNSSFSYFPIKTRTDNPYVIAPYLWSRPNNHYMRWAAPANLYKDWYWQDEIGNLHSYNDCLPVRDSTIDFYMSEYSISVPADYIKRKGFISLLPDGIKKPLRKVLSVFFPAHIG